MKTLKIIFILLCLSVGIAQAQNKITVYADSIIKTVSPLLTGACIEDVNHEIYGGLYSQMIFGESFQELPMDIYAAINPKFKGLSGQLSCKAPRDVLKDEPEIRSWQPVKTGTATGAFNIDSLHPYVGKQSQVIKFIGGQGAIGIENCGLNREGLSLTGQKLYEGNICIKVGKPTQLYIALENEDGSIIYAETRLAVNSSEWKKYDFRLVPSKSALHARLSITLRQPGEAELGYVFMQPGAWGRYQGLPVRKDVVEGLLKEKLTVMRYGGSMTLADNYSWKNMIGPRDKRRPYKGIWYPFSSNGWGIIDFMDLCEAMHITGIPDFRSGEMPQDMADFVEYANGGTNTVWGEKRAAAGHPQPYHLKYLELGNEQFNSEALTAKFKLLADAIWSKDPSIQIIFCLSDDTREDAGGDIANLKQTVNHCRETGHQAWFDVHILNETEKEPDLTDFEFAEHQLDSVAPDHDFRLCIFEENADNARTQRTLGHANAINRVQRLPYDIPILCAANCLQVDHQNDNGWDQGLLFFNQLAVWGQGSYYVSQMAADNYLPVSVKSRFTSKTDTLDVTPLKSIDGKTMTVQVVNSQATAVKAKVVLKNYTGHAAKVTVTQLKGNTLNDRNTADEPYKIVPLKNQATANSNSYTFAPYSFTVLRFEY
jgi:alpha-L-arabinofuranosidase